MMFPHLTECARDGIAVTASCRVLGFPRQAYYRWLGDPVCQREWDDAYLTNSLVDAHADNQAFGYRLLSDEVNASSKVASENRVHRLCRAQELTSTVLRRRRGKGRTGPAVHDNLERREFRATGPRVADRHHRASHDRGRGRHLRGQGLLVTSDRRLGHLGPDDVTSR